MITIMTKHDDNSTLDFLATECEYQVTISEIDGAVNSALCEGKDAGKQARDVIDSYKLLGDNCDPFPSTTYIFNYVNPFINSVGL